MVSVHTSVVGPIAADVGNQSSIIIVGGSEDQDQLSPRQPRWRDEQAPGTLLKRRNWLQKLVELLH